MVNDVSEAVMEELRKCELDIFSEFISICEKLDVKYFLVGGTLLGAVRHQGFIPWDDDIDVGMLRADYNIFIQNAPGLLPEYYFLQTVDTDPEFPHNFAKIRDSRTTFIETTMKRFHMNHGAFIDIFPFDYYPESTIKAKVIEFKKKFIKARIDEGFVFEEPVQRSILGKVMLAISKVVYPQIPKAVKARGKLYVSCKKSSKVTNFCGMWGSREVIPKKWVEDTCELKFENIDVDCPKGYAEYLTSVYGDYMKLPPVEERVGHHYTEYIDMERPYTIYMKQLKEVNKKVRDN